MHAERVTEEDFDLTMAVHIKGAFNVVKNAWRLMREQEYGRIVLTSSGASFGAKNYWCAWRASVDPFPPSLSSQVWGAGCTARRSRR